MHKKSRLLINAHCNLCHKPLYKGDMAIVDLDWNLITCTLKCYRKAIIKQKQIYKDLNPGMFK